MNRKELALVGIEAQLLQINEQLKRIADILDTRMK